MASLSKGLLREASAQANIRSLREHRVPSPDESRTISDMISLMVNEKNRVDIKINHLRSLLNLSRRPDALLDMERLLSKLVAQIATSRAVIAPVRRLPTELLGIVFIFAAMDLDGDSSNISFYPGFSQACVHWRSVALATPQLWNHVVLPDPHLPPDSTPEERRVSNRLWKLVPERLSRTGRAPVYLELQGHTWWQPTSWACLLSSTGQWRTLKWCLRGNVPPARSQTPDLGALESVALKMLFDGHKIPSAVDLLRLDFFSRASRVRRFTFDVADPRIKDVLIPPAWKITHLRVNAAISCAINQVERAGGLPLQLLKRCRETLLEAHVVHAYSYRPFIVPAEDEGPLVDLPRLTILKVSKTAGHIMTRIDAPNLTYLVIDRARIDISLVTYLCRLTERHPSIRRLDLTALFWAETAMATIMPCLTALSTIQHLHVSNDNVDGFTIEIDKASRSIINIPFLTSLTCQRTGAPVLFPNLTSLSLKFAGIWPGPDPDAEYNKVVSEELVAAVRGLVRSRRVERLVDGLPVAALQSFTTDLPGLSHVDLQDI